MEQSAPVRSEPLITRRFSVAIAVALVGMLLLTVTGALLVGPAVATRPAHVTGFSKPFSGPDRYVNLAPTQARNTEQINRPIGQKWADRIARHIGLDKEHVLTDRQYRLFISGRGRGGKPDCAKLADASVRIFTNTTGRPLLSNVDGVPTKTVLASYGLFVNTEGQLQSLANTDAPTRKANKLLEPGGYINTWFRANGARRSLIQLYRSAYTVEAIYGNKAQTTTNVAQLVTNVKKHATTQVGMSMAPALWLTNFALLYTLKPSVAAEMPAYWTPIPPTVAEAVQASKTGQVPYGDFASYF